MRKTNSKENVGVDDPVCPRNKGITLIALVITIIVLLILAIVSINLVMNGGIIGHAESAVKKYETAQTDEQDKISGVEQYIEGIKGEKLPNELAEYILGADGEGRDFFGIINEDDGAITFKQDPTNESSTMHTQVKFAYIKENEELTYYIRYNREVYKFAIQVFEDDETGEVEVKTSKESLIKVNTAEGNLGKYVTYEGITWIVLRENSEKVELISADALGEVTLGSSESGEEGRNKKRISYNTALETLVATCKTATGINANIRNVGGPELEEALSESNTVVFNDLETFVATDDFSKYEGKENGFRKGDTNYVSDCEQMEKLGILVTDTPADYFLSSRLVRELTVNVNFGVRKYGCEGELGYYDICYVDNGKGDMIYTPSSYAVRPVITLEGGILNGATQTGLINDPIILD